jgi:hypothetical protein
MLEYWALIFITVGVRGAIYTRSIELLENLNIPTSLIKKPKLSTK